MRRAARKEPKDQKGGLHRHKNDRVNEIHKIHRYKCHLLITDTMNIFCKCIFRTVQVFSPLLCAMRLYLNFVMSLACIAAEYAFQTCLPAILECAHTLGFICICNNFMCRRCVSKKKRRNLNIRDFIWVNLIVLCITLKHAHIHTSNVIFPHYSECFYSMDVMVFGRKLEYN